MHNAQGRKRVLIAVIGVVILALFLFVFLRALEQYDLEGEERATPIQVGDTSKPDRIDIEARILTLDPILGLLMLQVRIVPQGALAAEGGYSYAQTLELNALGASNQTRYILTKGEPAAQLDLTYSLDGDANDYPYDQHSTTIWIVLRKETAPEMMEDAPTTFSLTGHVAGFKIDATSLEGVVPMGSGFELQIDRSQTVLVAATAGMVIEWAVGLGVIALIVLMLRGWFDIRILSVFAALLFGLFSLRNSLPGTPPIGAYSDYLAFLWVEGIVAVALLVGIVQNIRLKP
jgi:hypothetical protein